VGEVGAVRHGHPGQVEDVVPDADPAARPLAGPGEDAVRQVGEAEARAVGDGDPGRRGGAATGHRRPSSRSRAQRGRPPGRSPRSSRTRRTRGEPRRRRPPRAAEQRGQGPLGEQPREVGLRGSRAAACTAARTLRKPCCSKPSDEVLRRGMVQPRGELEGEGAVEAAGDEGGELGLGRVRAPRVPPVRYLARSAPSSASTSSAPSQPVRGHLDVRGGREGELVEQHPGRRAGVVPGGSAISTCCRVARSSWSKSRPIASTRPVRPSSAISPIRRSSPALGRLEQVDGRRRGPATGRRLRRTTRACARGGPRPRRDRGALPRREDGRVVDEAEGQSRDDGGAAPDRSGRRRGALTRPRR
jgi:hypothetical protein